VLDPPLHLRIAYSFRRRSPRAVRGTDRDAGQLDGGSAPGAIVLVLGRVDEPSDRQARETRPARRNERLGPGSHRCRERPEHLHEIRHGLNRTMKRYLSGTMAGE